MCSSNQNGMSRVIVLPAGASPRTAMTLSRTSEPSGGSTTIRPLAGGVSRGPGLNVGAEVGLGDAEGVGVGDGLGEGLCDGLGVGEGVGLGEGVGDGDGVGEGDAVGCVNVGRSEIVGVGVAPAIGGTP